MVAKTGPFFASLYFWTFNVVVLYMLINIFLAILIDAVGGGVATAPDLISFRFAQWSSGRFISQPGSQFLIKKF